MKYFFEHFRPIAGHANLCPSSISTKRQELDILLSTVKHEMLHALGFSVSLFAFYRDKVQLLSRDSRLSLFLNSPGSSNLLCCVSFPGRQPAHSARRERKAQPERGTADATVVGARHPTRVPRVEDPRGHHLEARPGRCHAESAGRGSSHNGKTNIHQKFITDSRKIEPMVFTERPP